MKISIGSGEKRIEDYINCDYDKNANPDYCFDLEKDPFPFDDNSVDEVLASHVLEHLGDGYFHCIKELYRVCKHNAIIHVFVPHHRNDNFADDPTHKRPITVRGLKLFSKRLNQLGREQGVYASKLGEFFDVNFEVVDWNYTPEKKYIERFNGLPKDEVEEYIEQHYNIIHEIYIKLVVIKDYDKRF
jgi:predicted SAM-dependent methyltransferase